MAQVTISGGNPGNTVNGTGDPMKGNAFVVHIAGVQNVPWIYKGAIYKLDSNGQTWQAGCVTPPVATGRGGCEVTFFIP